MSLLIPAPPKRQRALSFEEIEEEYEERTKRVPFHFSDESDDSDDSDSDKSHDGTNDSFTMEEIKPRFEVERVLGKGSFGLVVRAFDPICQRTIAVKRLRQIFTSAEVAQRVLNETKLLKALGIHPNITSLYALLKESSSLNVDDFNSIYMVLEVAHSDLFKILNSTIFLDHDQVQSIMHQTLTALAWIHSHHVIHCDVKPANLLVNSDCRIRLADFGLSRWSTQSDTNQEGNTSTKFTSRISSQVAMTSKGHRFLRVDSFCDDSMHLGQHDTLDTFDPIALECCYRAPEVLWPSSDNEPYRSSLDLWSAGCVFADLLKAMKTDSKQSVSESESDHQPTHKVKGGKEATPSLPLDSEGRVLGGHKSRPPLFAISEPPVWLGLMSSSTPIKYTPKDLPTHCSSSSSPATSNGRRSKSPRPQVSSSFSSESRRVLGSFLHVLGTNALHMKEEGNPSASSSETLSQLVPYLSLGARDFVGAAASLMGGSETAQEGCLEVADTSPPLALSLLRELLGFAPHLRPTADEALNSKYFTGVPRITPPTAPVNMPAPGIDRSLITDLRKELWDMMDGTICQSPPSP